MIRSSAHVVLSTNELLEQILLATFDGISNAPADSIWQTNWNSIDRDAGDIKKVLLIRRVNITMNVVINTSPTLQKKLFLRPDLDKRRSWTRQDSDEHPPAEVMYHQEVQPFTQLPLLNPVIQSIFSTLTLRFWNLPLQGGENRWCAFMIISRDEANTFNCRLCREGQMSSVSRMLFSQPPCKRMLCTVFEDRDETRDYVDRTTEISGCVIEDDMSLRLGLVMGRLSQMFEQHPDISKIKLVTD